MTTNLDRVVLIAVAGDSGCGKSTFLRRLTDLFGEEFMTVICLDDYHSLDQSCSLWGLRPLHQQLFFPYDLNCDSHPNR